MQFWTNSWKSNPQNSNCTATYLPSHKSFKWDAQDMLGTAGSSLIFSHELQHSHTNVGQPAKTYVRRQCANTGCTLKDLHRVKDDRDGEREREKERKSQGTPRYQHDLKTIIIIWNVVLIILKDFKL